ncbi:hypothetical protein HEP87_00430 [Streptomyces sp. S1D4-11]|nr:hypothetical protein [Streptomyces sp. S1D4-11]
MVNVLFDDFCNADDPAPWLGRSLRTEEEVALMKKLGDIYSTVQAEVGRDAPDEVCPDAPAWSNVIAVAGRLTQVMVTNDLQAAALLHEQLNLPHYQRPAEGAPTAE